MSEYLAWYGDPQVRVFVFITWYKAELAWTHALEGPHVVNIIALRENGGPMRAL